MGAEYIHRLFRRPTQENEIKSEEKCTSDQRKEIKYNKTEESKTLWGLRYKWAKQRLSRVKEMFVTMINLPGVQPWNYFAPYSLVLLVLL